jgi:DNA polymerase-3 subunit gamma/tau
VAPEDDEPSVDDPTAEDSGMIGQPVVERLLGGKVIDIEERH